MIIKKKLFFYSFGDRGKRLKLQQFIAKKADTLYDKSNLDRNNEPIKQELGDEGNFYNIKYQRFIKKKIY